MEAKPNRNDPSFLMFVGKLFSQLDGLCHVSEVRWLPRIGVAAVVIDDESARGQSSTISLNLANSGQPPIFELRVGESKFVLHDPDEISQIIELQSRDRFWQSARKAA